MQTPKVKFRTCLILGTLLIGVTRLAAVSASIWDWDEAQFCLSLGDYDIAAGHPHPPGFPLYVALGRLVRSVTGSPFEALQLINVTAAIALFPVLTWLALSMGFSRHAALLSAATLMVAPNIWFYGGTAYSDIPSLLSAALCALLFYRATKRPKLFLYACASLGLALSIRPHTLLLAAWPLALAVLALLRNRSIRTLLTGCVLTTVIVGTSYIAAARATGWTRYVEAVQKHSAYIMRVDSYRNATRPSLGSVALEYLFAPHHATLAGAITMALALLAVMRPRQVTRNVVFTFGPFLVFAIFMLDVNSIDRFSVSTIPLNVYLATDGAALWWRSSKARVISQMTGCAVISALMIAHTLPALEETRRNVAPPVQALLWVRSHLAPITVVYVDQSMNPFAEYMIPRSMRRHLPLGARLHDPAAGSWFVSAGGGSGLHGTVFRAAPILQRLTTHPYYETTVERADGIAAFGEGWYDIEQSGGHAWRWAGGSATLEFPRSSEGAILSLSLHVPLELLPVAPTLSLTVNGTRVLSTTPRDANVNLRCSVPTRADANNVVSMRTDRVANPSALHRSSDPRDLGFQLFAYEWETTSETTNTAGAGIPQN